MGRQHFQSEFSVGLTPLSGPEFLMEVTGKSCGPQSPTEAAI